jgi:hypothetical protein
MPEDQADEARGKMVLMGGRKLPIDEYVDLYRKLKRREPHPEEAEKGHRASQAKRGRAD